MKIDVEEPTASVVVEITQMITSVGQWVTKTLVDPMLPTGTTTSSIMSSFVKDNASKHLKEAFVTGYHGSSKTEVILVLFVLITSIFSSAALSFLSSHFRNRGLYTRNVALRSLFRLFGWLTSIVNFILFPLSCLASLTLSPYNILLSALHLWIAFGSFALASVIAIPIGSPVSQRFVPAFTRLRGSLLILTSLSILAVDFHVFPRFFVKTETFGVSLMDIGVGGFMFVNAITSNLARAGSQRVESSMKRTLSSLLPLLIIGVFRTIAHIGVNYQHHVSEYGVHWNYFYTLAGVLLVSDLLLAIYQATIISPLPPADSGSVSRISVDITNKTRVSLVSGLLGLVAIALHQICLSDFNLTEYVFEAPRITFVSANKEGLVSVLGYLALTLISIPVGRILADYSTLMKLGNKISSKRRIHVALITTLVLGFLSLGSFGLVLFLEENVQPVSRRLCNAAFVFWIFSLSTGLLAASFVPDIFTETVNSIINQNSTILEKEKEPNVEDRLFVNNFVGPALSFANERPLLFFMVSNLMTGFVNTVTDTMSVADHDAICILSIYIILCLVAPKIIKKF